MTATALRLQLPALQPHQMEVRESPAPYKLHRAGRRSGKSTTALVCSVDGHGPRHPKSGARTFPGLLQGGHVGWVAKTYKQSRAIWRRLLRRFRGMEGHGVTINREEMRVELGDDYGCIAVWSGHTRDALDNLRGDYYDGVVFDEGAYVDLKYGVEEVALPALLDRGGWLLIPSTPNAGWDKNEERITPSYFNRLCSEILSGRRSKAWQHWHHVPEDNARLSPVALRELRSQYPPDSVAAQQELDAALVAGGLLAFTIDRRQVLVPALERIPDHWTVFGAIDWGYSHPFSFGLYGVTEGGLIVRVDGVHGRKLVPSQIGERVKAVLDKYLTPEEGLSVFRRLRYTVAGGDVFDEIRARGETGPTISEKWSQMGWSVIRATTKRVSGLNNARLYLADHRVRFCETPNNLRVLGCLESRITDPTDPEDVFKQDADSNGNGGDDEYDEWRYALMSRPIIPKAPAQPHDYVDHNAGFEAMRKRGRPEPTPSGTPHWTGGTPKWGKR